jgi:hypothetical protein
MSKTGRWFAGAVAILLVGTAGAAYAVNRSSPHHSTVISDPEVFCAGRFVFGATTCPPGESGTDVCPPGSTATSCSPVTTGSAAADDSTCAVTLDFIFADIPAKRCTLWPSNPSFNTIDHVEVGQLPVASADQTLTTIFGTACPGAVDVTWHETNTPQTPAGRVVCFTDATGTANIAWTYTATGLTWIATALPTVGPGALYTWWTTHS